MAAVHLPSQHQKDVRKQLAQLDRKSADFFAVAPIVIDCSDDGEEFSRRLNARQRADVADRYRSGELKYVSGLHRPAHDYARDKIAERYRSLDPNTRKIVGELLDDWWSARGRQPHQKSRSESNASGVDIILPLGGIRLSYDASTLLTLS